MTTRTLYKPPLRARLLRLVWPLIKVPAKVVVLAYVLAGWRYPAWMLTPDDPKSPFGQYEPTMVTLYKRFGAKVGDLIWLAWRNALYGLNYTLKPDFLKKLELRYMDLAVVDERTPGDEGHFTPGGDYVERLDRVGTVYVQTPDKTWLHETTRKLGPIFLVTGYRLSGIAAGKREDDLRVAQGLQPVPRPTQRPNMDGRPVVTVRTSRTM